jgi:hypothetical protein
MIAKVPARAPAIMAPNWEVEEELAEVLVDDVELVVIGGLDVEGASELVAYVAVAVASTVVVS